MQGHIAAPARSTVHQLTATEARTEYLSGAAGPRLLLGLACGWAERAAGPSAAGLSLRLGRACGWAERAAGLSVWLG